MKTLLALLARLIFWRKAPTPIELPPPPPSHSMPTRAEMRATHLRLRAKFTCHDPRCPAFGKHRCHNRNCKEHRQ